MKIFLILDRLHARARENRWISYFAIFNRLALAAGFLPAGIVKIAGERFASGLSPNHPMGHYLTALHQTGYYYTFIGYLQVAAAILLLIPATAALGSLIYFPVILNICILSFALRFEGSLLSSPLMLLSNLFLLCWYYDRIKFLLPFRPKSVLVETSAIRVMNNKFPIYFFGGSLAAIVIMVLAVQNAFSIMPRNSLPDCYEQCKDNKNLNACYVFCDCIHKNGQPLDSCLAKYRQVAEEKANSTGKNE